MKLSKSEKLFVLIILLLLLMLSTLLYRDLTSRLADEGTRVIGELVIKRNTAQRKYSSQVIWESLENRVPLYNRDTIRTGQNSEAMLLLTDGTEINVDENSMVVLNISDKTMDIAFEGGAVQIIGGKKSSEITVSSGDKKIELGSSDIQLSKEQGKEDFNLTVNSGEVQLDADGESLTVGENETAQVGESGKVAVEENPVSLKLPSSGARLFLQNPEASIPFTWDAGNNEATLEISPSRTFRTIVTTIKSSQNTASVKLRSGSYYWRVSIKDKDGNARVTTGRRISVIEQVPLKLTAPSDNFSITYAAEEPYVNFSWLKNDLASGYVLQISKKSDFSSLFDEIDSVTTNIAKKLPRGTYYWRVRMKSNLESAVQLSQPRKFSISQNKELAPPKAVRPTSGKALGANLFASEGVVFNWIADRESVESEIWISSDNSFPESGRIVLNAPGNFLIVKRNLPRGNYNWKVRSKDSNGKYSNFSNTMSFTIAETLRLGLVSPDNRQSIEQAQAANDGINLVWENIQTGADYRLTISSNEDLSNPVLQEKYNVNRSNFKPEQPGKYYWSVTLLDNNGDSTVTSDVRQFSVIKQIAEPVPEFPGSGSTVEMSTRDSLPFRWKAGEQTDLYRFTLYHNKGGIRKKIYETETANTRLTITDLSLLDIGDFSWSIEAVRKTNRGEVGSREVITHFKISLGDFEPVKILTPEIQYIEVKDLNKKIKDEMSENPDNNSARAANDDGNNTGNQEDNPSDEISPEKTE